MKLKIEKVLMLLLLFVASAAQAQSVYTADDVENVNVSDRRKFVTDPQNLVPADVKARVNERLLSLRKSSTVEMAVVVVPSIGDEPIEDFSEQVFTKWGIGKKDKDNGVLLVLVPDDHSVRIQTGYGTEGVLTDIVCKRIIEKAVVPAMREDNIGAAIDNSTQLLTQALTDSSVAEELRSEQADNEGGALDTISSEIVWNFIWGVAAVIFILCLVMFCRDLVKNRRLDNYRRSLAWRRHLPLYFWGSLFSAGAAFPLALLALFIYRSSRTRRIKCDTCGTKMNRMSEEEDNNYLSLSQDLEEKLKTVDYDVWVCPKCGTIERFPYRERQSVYSECPKCHTVASRLKMDKVIVPPTTRSEGIGEKIYECEFCHNQERKRYRIPKKDDDSGAGLLAAGAILGSGLGRGGGGGGFGGGFGGGATGGGGASGSW